MEIKIVLGTLWGNCGKGNTVQWLCKKAIDEGKKPLVVRFSGGPQAGHTVRHNGITHVCSSYGSGVLLGVPTLYMGGFIDPLCITKEKKVLEDKGIKGPLLFAEDSIPLITPYDVADQQEWAKDNPCRTCGKGVMSAVLRNTTNEKRFTSRVEDLQQSSFDTLRNAIDYYYRFKNEYYDIEHSILVDWRDSAEFLKNELNRYILSNYNVLIFEGTQGLLLDVENGYYPYTTSTKVGLNGIPEKYLKDAEVYLVSRTYLTRHGVTGKREEKWFNEERKINIPDTKLETNVTNEYQGNFVTALWHNEPYSEAVHRHRLDNYMNKYNIKFNLVVTHMDVKEAAGKNTTIQRHFEYFFPNSIRHELEEAGLKIKKIYSSDNPDSKFKLIYHNEN